MSKEVIISWANAKRPCVVPFFLPFRGCRHRCLYCAQDVITGVSQAFSLEEDLQQLSEQLIQRRRSGADAPELAFYGGTFTAQPERDFALCVRTAADLRAQGLVSAVRASTRPDALEPSRLADMAEAGFTTLELGIQSFSDAVLAASGRGYGSLCAKEACGLVTAQGFTLGVQLMPGLPCGTSACFLADVETALQLGAACLRFYPCLVLRNTELANQWARGLYEPWGLSDTVETLARGYTMAQERHVPVIRMGLSLSRALEAAVLAGPVHPALGACVMARALYRRVREAGQGSLFAIALPPSVQGFFWGDRHSMQAEWAMLGVTRANVFRSDDADIHLFFAD